MTPPTMRVAVELGFVIGCADCLSVLESTSAAAFRDQQVTRFVAVPGKKHAHEAENKSGVPQHLESGAGAATGQLEGQNTLFEATSDTNGSHPDDVLRMLDREMGVTA